MESSRAGNPHVTAFSVVTWGCDMAEVRNCLYLQSFLAIVSLVTGVTAELQDCEIFTTTSTWKASRFGFSRSINQNRD